MMHASSVLRDRSLPFTFVDAVEVFLETLDHVNDAQQLPIKEMKTPTAMEALLVLHVLSFVTTESKCKKFRMKLAYTTGTLIRLFIQLIMKAWKVLFQQGRISSVSTAIGPHMGYHEGQLRFLVFSKPCSSTCHEKQKHSLSVVGSGWHVRKE